MLSLGLLLGMSKVITDVPCGGLDRNAGEKEGSGYGQPFAMRIVALATVDVNASLEETGS
jgi:hypothetical protein